MTLIRRTLPRAAALALLALLAAAPAAHALDGFGTQPAGPFAFNPDAAQHADNPYYLRYDYAVHKRGYHSLDTDHRLLATYDNMGVLLEHTASYPQPPSGHLWMDRAAFVVGARDPDGNSLHVGVGQSVLYGAQKASMVSLVLLASSPISASSAFELNFGLPAVAVSRGLALRHNTLREADGEAAIAFKTRHAALRVGYRTFAVQDAMSTAGWFVGVSLYM